MHLHIHIILTSLREYFDQNTIDVSLKKKKNISTVHLYVITGGTSEICYTKNCCTRTVVKLNVKLRTSDSKFSARVNICLFSEYIFQNICEQLVTRLRANIFSEHCQIAAFTMFSIIKLYQI